MTQLQFWQDRKANALRNLAKPAVIYPNGRNSHDVENEVLEEAEGKLIDFYGITLNAKNQWVGCYIEAVE